MRDHNDKFIIAMSLSGGICIYVYVCGEVGESANILVYTTLRDENQSTSIKIQHLKLLIIDKRYLGLLNSVSVFFLYISNNRLRANIYNNSELDSRHEE